MKVTPVQRGYLIRTLLLVLVICGVTFVVSRLYFESEADIQVEGWNSVFSLVVGIIGGWFFVIRPMGETIRSDAETRDRDFSDRFASVIESMQDGVIVYDRNGVVTWNQSALKTMAVSAEDMRRNQVVHPSLKFMNEDGSPLLQQERPTQQCFRTGLPVAGSLGIQRSDGRTQWLRVQASPVFAKISNQDRRKGKSPEVESVIATFRDVTSEREAMQRFELAMKAVRLGVWDMDLVSGILTWDEAMFQLYGLEPSASKRGLQFFESCIFEEDRERVMRTFELALRERRDVSTEFRIQLPSGELRVIRAESKGFYSPEGTPLRHVGVNWDVTLEREQELRVIQASKMSTLGEMSAGIAHEINNPLAIILGKTEAMRTAMSAPELNRELMNRHVETVERTANRIAKIVKGLRTFSRDGDQDPFEATKVSEIVNEAVTLCNSRFLNYGIELYVASAPMDLMIDARAVQISQVLLNLLNNAFDAVSLLEEKWVRLEVRTVGSQIEFVVTDSGAGIPQPNRKKLMQPFFTTKEVGMGTGLGLSIASGIVIAHGGIIELEETSLNTRFVVRLPRSQADSAKHVA